MKMLLPSLLLLSLGLPVIAHADAPTRKQFLETVKEEDGDACHYPEAVGKTPDEVMTGYFPETAFIRVLKLNQPVTMEYRFGRINLNVDDNGIIVSVTCG